MLFSNSYASDLLRLFFKALRFLKRIFEESVGLKVFPLRDIGACEVS